jgi:hypothetical protein
VRAFPFLVLMAVPIVAYLAYRSWKQDQKRREQLMVWCASSGYTFTVEDHRWVDRWSGEPFGQGDHRQARNVVTGRIGDQAFAAFDYSYETHSTDSKGNRTTTTHRYVVASLQLTTALPRLQVTPEGLFGRIGNALGLDDIELESEDFNRRFRVHSDNRKFACDVLSPRTMEALLARPEMSWRTEGVDILAWQTGRLTPVVLMSLTSGLRTVIAGIPSFVWKDHS